MDLFYGIKYEVDWNEYVFNCWVSTMETRNLYIYIVLLNLSFSGENSQLFVGKIKIFEIYVLLNILMSENRI